MNRFEVCIDVTNPDVVRPFWQMALGYEPVEVADGAVILKDPDGIGATVWFQRVPEAKDTKNRVHLDVWPGSESDVRILAAKLTELGGSGLREFDDFIVFADPEGNELCLIWEELDSPEH